jgi:hypothetical protein
MKKSLIVAILSLFSGLSLAQFGAAGGISVLKAFGIPKPYVGIHFGGEIPRDDQVSLYGRISFYGKQEDPTKNFTNVNAIDPLTFPSSKNVIYQNAMNYTIIEGGTRYYIGDGYDSGFGAYGGGNVSALFNTIKRKYGDYDQSLYQLNTTEMAKGSIFNIGFGLVGGLKNTFAGIGTLYFDAGFSYLILSIPSSNNISTNMYTPLIFTFNFGFRKEFY